MVTPKIDLTTHCALCGAALPVVRVAGETHLAWCSDSGWDHRGDGWPDRPDLLCKCKEESDG